MIGSDRGLGAENPTYLATATLIAQGRIEMAGSTYKIIELVGTSDKSWEDAAKNAVETAGGSLQDLRIAEVIQMDMTLENGKVTSYRTRLKVSFKYVK